MKQLSTLLIIIFFSTISFLNCKKDGGISEPVIVADSLPFENSDIKISAVADMPFNASDIFFPDSLNGIAITGDGKIYRTENAGTNWKLQYTNISPVTFHQILFINAQTGFVVGGSTTCSGNGCVPPGGIILKTTDGGVNWHTVLSNQI